MRGVDLERDAVHPVPGVQGSGGQDLDAVETGELLLRLASSSLPKKMYPFTLGWINANSKASHETLTASLDAVNDWPHRFYATLSKDDRPYGYIDPRRVRSLVKAIESWLEGKRVEGRGIAIAKAIEAYRIGCTTFPIPATFHRS